MYFQQQQNIEKLKGWHESRKNTNYRLQYLVITLYNNIPLSYLFNDLAS
jgi:hypothetical protein